MLALLFLFPLSFLLSLAGKVWDLSLNLTRRWKEGKMVTWGMALLDIWNTTLICCFSNWQCGVIHNLSFFYDLWVTDPSHYYYNPVRHLGSLHLNLRCWRLWQKGKIWCPRWWGQAALCFSYESELLPIDHPPCQIVVNEIWERTDNLFVTVLEAVCFCMDKVRCSS